MGLTGRSGSSAVAAQALRVALPPTTRVALLLAAVVLLFAACFLLLSACGGPDETEIPNVQQMASESLNKLSPEEVEAVRAVAASYWEAWNAYDVDKVRGMLDEAFRSQQGEQICSNIEKLDRWNMSISWTEVTPPKLDPSGEVVMYVTVKKSLSTDLTQMRFRKSGSTWIIVWASKDQP